MGRHTAAEFARWVKRAEEKTFRADRLNIGHRLIVCFVVIILSMLAGDAVVLWQFHRVRAQAERLNGIDQKLVAVLHVHTSLLAFYDRLDELAQAQDAGQLVTEAGPLRAAVLEDTQRARSALSLLPPDFQRDATIMPTLLTIQSALPSQLDAITSLAISGDWGAVRLRLANQVRPLESLTAALAEKVENEAAEEQAQTVLNIERGQRRVFLIVPLTALFTLLMAATLGLTITRSITQPLARLVEGSRALARGEFQHQVAIRGEDELGHLGEVFNDTAARLRDLYATLQSSEDRLRLVIDTIPAHVWSARPDGSVDFISQRWLEFTGLSLAAGLGWDWSSVVHPDDLPRFVDAWRQALAAGAGMESEARLRRADGEYRWWLIRNVPLRDERGNIVKWYGTSIDIDDRKRAEQALRRSQAYLADAQSLTHTGSWAYDGTTRKISYWSEETSRLWGFDPQQGLPTWDQMWQRIHPEDLCELEKLSPTLLEKGDSDFEYRIVLPDATVKHLHTLAHPVLSPTGEVLEVVGTTVDITERKRAEEERERLRQLEAELAHLNRVSMLGELAVSIAHEVNQPLSGIVSNGSACLRFLARDTPDVEEACEAARDIVRDGKRAGEVIARIRALTKRAATPREELDLNDTIREVLALVGDEAKKRNVIIRTQLADDLSPVSGDRVQLQQVGLNLIMNGIEAMSGIDQRPRELVITTRRMEPDQVQVTVEDSGTGLDPNTMGRIFDPFYTTKAGGMGMGLSVSRSILQAHGGRLWATVNDGPGTSFHFTLPKYHAGAADGGVAGV
ncbi:MAG TPA: PAS domain-containing protein [Terriglobia bacterium]|nr:PAS domain-containing protein [Terriglobia bacterium]